MYFNNQGMTLLNLQRKVYNNVLEVRLLLIVVEPQLQEEKGGFGPGSGPMNKIFTLAELPGGDNLFEDQI